MLGPLRLECEGQIQILPFHMEIFPCLLDPKCPQYQAQGILKHSLSFISSQAVSLSTKQLPTKAETEHFHNILLRVP